MKIAIPMANGRLCPHFGHCEVFGFYDVHEGNITSHQEITPPPHEPGLLPKWIKEQGADLVIAGGMGQRAIAIFDEHGVKVHVGAPPLDGESIIKAFMSDTLEAGANACDH